MNQGLRQTIATCCPVASSNTYSVRASATSTEPWWATEVCAWGPPTGTITHYTYTSTGTDGTQTKTGSMSNGGSINAYGIEIRWQSTDFSTPPATAVETTTQATPTETQTSTGGGLKTGAQVGIGVGVAAGVLVIALALGLLYFRRRKRQQLEPIATQDPSAGGTSDSVYKGQSTELSTIGHQKAELPAEPAQSNHKLHQVEPVELDGQSLMAKA